MHEDGSDSLFPVKRMPTGLLSTLSIFFIATAITQVSSIAFFRYKGLYLWAASLQLDCPEDYRLWQQTMFTLFGTKWVKII